MRSDLQSSFRMKIPGGNIAGRVLYFMGTLFLLCNLIAIAVESKLEDDEPLLDHLVESGMINQEMAELLQSNCMVEFLHTKKTLLSLDSHLTSEKSNDADDLINNRPSGAKLHNTINNFLPQINQVLVDCVREKKLIFRITEREKDSDSTTWYENYFGFLFTSNRRVLAETPIESPAPSPSFTSPSPSPSVFPDKAQNPSASPPKIPFFPPDKSDLQPSANEVSSNGSNVGSNGQKTSKRTVIIAVVVTASVTLLAALLLFLFWQRCCGKSARRNDERPLLSLSLSDYSIASPHKSFGLGTSIDEEKLGNNQSFNSKPNHNDKVNTNYYLESHSLSNPKIEATIVNTSFTNVANLENSQVSISPALPPPPGRTNPPKPPPSNVSPPTPPAPPAMPFSGGPRPPPPLPPQVKPPSSTGGPRPPPPGPPPPPRPAVSSGLRPPPPPVPGGGVPPPRPPNMGLKPPRPLAPGPRPPSSSSASVEDGGPGNNNKAKLKPFFWDKVLANPDQSMVWHQIKSGSFQFNEEMIETLFGYAPADKNKNETKKESSSQDVQNQFIRLIDPKKAQNLAIMLKALNVTTEEVCDALEEGNELPAELIQTLLKMAPTTDEELKLRLYSGDVSQLGPAERFLKVLVDIPHAFKRLESLLFMSTIQEDVSMLKESFEVLEAACTELRKSRLFLKLLEAVLKTGNRMNDGTFRGGAQAFKLDTLLKLSDVKGTDGKTTLLHFVVQEIIRSEGIKAVRTKAQETHSSSSFKSYNKSSFENAITEEEDSDEHFRSIGLQVVSGLTYELENVKKAANLDLDSITTTVSKLGKELKKSRDFSNNEMKNVSKENGFYETLKSFVRNAEVDVMWSFEEEKRIMTLVKSTTDYFHGSNSGRDEGLRLFVIVRDFLVILDKVCKQVKEFPVIKTRKEKTKKGEGVVVEDSKPVVHVDHRQRLFPAIAGRRIDSSSSDDES